MRIDDFLFKHPTLDVTDVEFLKAEEPVTSKFLDTWHKTLEQGVVKEGETPIHLKAI